MNGEQNEAGDYLKEEQTRSLAAMDLNREVVSTTAVASVKLNEARARMRLRFSGCVVALTVLVWAGAIYAMARLG